MLFPLLVATLRRSSRKLRRHASPPAAVARRFVSVLRITWRNRNRCPLKLCRNQQSPPPRRPALGLAQDFPILAKRPKLQLTGSHRCQQPARHLHSPAMALHTKKASNPLRRSSAKSSCGTVSLNAASRAPRSARLGSMRRYVPNVQGRPKDRIARNRCRHQMRQGSMRSRKVPA